MSAPDITARGLAARALAQSGTNSVPNVLARDPARLPHWRLALAKYRTQVYRPRLLFVGDSKHVGIGAGIASDGTYQSVGAASRNKTTWLAQMLAERGYQVSRQSWCGSAGLASYTAINAYDPRRTLPADASFGSFSLGGGIVAVPSASTAATTYVPDAAVATNAVDILAWRRSAAGTAQVSDGTAAVQQSFTQATEALARVSFTGFARAAGKTYSLTRAAGGSLHPLCVIAYDSTVSQIEIVNAGSSGSTTANWVSTAGGTYAGLPAIQAYAADLTVVQLGTNDSGASSGVSVAAYAANLRAIIAAAQVSGDCVVEVPTQPQVTSSGYANYPAFAAAARATALAAGCVVLDHGARLGSWATASGGGMMFDSVHETANGYADEARALAEVLVL